MPKLFAHLTIILVVLLPLTLGTPARAQDGSLDLTPLTIHPAARRAAQPLVIDPQEWEAPLVTASDVRTPIEF